MTLEEIDIVVADAYKVACWQRLEDRRGDLPSARDVFAVVSQWKYNVTFEETLAGCERLKLSLTDTRETDRP